MKEYILMEFHLTYKELHGLQSAINSMKYIELIAFRKPANLYCCTSYISPKRYTRFCRSTKVSKITRSIIRTIIGQSLYYHSIWYSCKFYKKCYSILILQS